MLVAKSSFRYWEKYETLSIYVTDPYEKNTKTLKLLIKICLTMSDVLGCACLALNAIPLCVMLFYDM